MALRDMSHEVVKPVTQKKERATRTDKGAHRQPGQPTLRVTPPLLEI